MKRFRTWAALFAALVLLSSVAIPSDGFAWSPVADSGDTGASNVGKVITNRVVVQKKTDGNKLAWIAYEQIASEPYVLGTVGGPASVRGYGVLHMESAIGSAPWKSVAWKWSGTKPSTDVSLEDWRYTLFEDESDVYPSLTGTSRFTYSQAAGAVSWWGDSSIATAVDGSPAAVPEAISSPQTAGQIAFGKYLDNTTLKVDSSGAVGKDCKDADIYTDLTLDPSITSSWQPGLTYYFGAETVTGENAANGHTYPAVTDSPSTSAVTVQSGGDWNWLKLIRVDTKPMNAPTDAAASTSDGTAATTVTAGTEVTLRADISDLLKGTAADGAELSSNLCLQWYDYNSSAGTYTPLHNTSPAGEVTPANGSSASSTWTPTVAGDYELVCAVRYKDEDGGARVSLYSDPALPVEVTQDDTAIIVEASRDTVAPGDTVTLTAKTTEGPIQSGTGTWSVITPSETNGLQLGLTDQNKKDNPIVLNIAEDAEPGEYTLEFKSDAGGTGTVNLIVTGQPLPKLAWADPTADSSSPVSIPINGGPREFRVYWGEGVDPPAVTNNGTIVYTWESSKPGVLTASDTTAPTALITPVSQGTATITVTAAPSEGCTWEGAAPVSEDLKVSMLVTVGAWDKTIYFDPPAEENDPVDVVAGAVAGEMVTAKGWDVTGNLVPVTGTWKLITFERKPNSSQTDSSDPDLSVLTSSPTENVSSIVLKPGPSAPAGTYTLGFTPASDAYNETGNNYYVNVEPMQEPSVENQPQLQWTPGTSMPVSMTITDNPVEVAVVWQVKDAAVPPPPVAIGGGLEYSWAIVEQTPADSGQSQVIRLQDSNSTTASIEPINEGTAEIKVTASLRNGSSWLTYEPDPSKLYTTNLKIQVTASGSSIVSLMPRNMSVETMVGLMPASFTLAASAAGATNPDKGDVSIVGIPVTPTIGTAPSLFTVQYEPGTATKAASCTISPAAGASAPTVPGTWNYTVSVPADGQQPGVSGTFTLTVTDGVLLRTPDSEVVVKPGEVASGQALTALAAAKAGRTENGLVVISYANASGDAQNPLPDSAFKGSFIAGTASSPAKIDVTWAGKRTLETGGPWTYRATVIGGNNKVFASGTFTVTVAEGVFLGYQNVQIPTGHVHSGEAITTLTAAAAQTTADASEWTILATVGTVGDAANAMDPNSFEAEFTPGTGTQPPKFEITWAEDQILTAGGPWTYTVTVEDDAGNVIASGRFTLTIRDRVAIALTGDNITTMAGILPATGTTLRSAANGVTEAGTVSIHGAPASSVLIAAPDIFTATYTRGTNQTPARVTVSVKPGAQAPVAAGTWAYTVSVATPSGDPVAAGTFNLTVTPGPTAPSLVLPFSVPTGMPGKSVSVQIPWADEVPSNLENYAVQAAVTSLTAPATPELNLELGQTGAVGSLAIPAGASPGTEYTYDVILTEGTEARPPVRLVVKVSDFAVQLSSLTQVPVYAAVTVTAALQGFTNPTVTWTSAGCGNPLPADETTTATRASARFVPTSAGSLVVTVSVQDQDGTTVSEQRVITVGSGSGPDPTSSSTSYPTNPYPPTQLPTSSPSSSASASASASASQSAAPSGSASASASASSGPSSRPSSSQEPLSPNPSAPVQVELTTVANVPGTVLVGLPISTREDSHAAFMIPSYVVSPSGTTVEILTAEGQLITANDFAIPFATGQIVRVVDRSGTVLAETTVVVMGDVLGSGELNIAQLVRLAQACTGERPLSGVYRAAGDFAQNNRIDIADVVSEAKMITDRGR